MRVYVDRTHRIPTRSQITKLLAQTIRIEPAMSDPLLLRNSSDLMCNSVCFETASSNLPGALLRFASYVWSHDHNQSHGLIYGARSRQTRCWAWAILGGNPDGSWDVSDFEADPSRSQRASSDIRYFLAYGTRMGCLDRIGRYYYTHETKTQNRISNSSRAAVSGGIREDPLQSLDLSDCSFDIRKQAPHRNYFRGKRSYRTSVLLHHRPSRDRDVCCNMGTGMEGRQLDHHI
jgi:hypothetical protein